MNPPTVLAVHTAVPGRARFRVDGLKGCVRAKRALEAALTGRGILSVCASTTTGTVLVLFERKRGVSEIAQRLSDAAQRAFNPEQAAGSGAQPAWHTLNADAVMAEVRSKPAGLSENEAKRRLAENGANAIAKLHGRASLEILLGQFHNLPVALLTAGALLSLATGGVLDAAVILGVIGINGIIGFVAEARAEETISSLDESRAPISRVLRDRTEREVPGEELVVGDVIELRRDETIPADARVIAENRLTINEALLTGESAPVAKSVNILTQPNAAVADRHNMVFRGTVVTGGAGRAVVVATGAESEIGRIQSLLGSEERPPTPLERQLNELSRQLVLASAAACGLFAMIGLTRRFPLLSLLRTVISLAIAAIPEGLPTLATTTLALAVRDLRRRRVIIRRLGAVEGLAAAQVVCFDKTGTLTLNDMSVVRLYWNRTRARLGGDRFQTDGGSVVDCATDAGLARLFELAALCNDADLAVPAAHDWNGSATELALVRAAVNSGINVEAVRERHPREATVHRADDRRYMLTVHCGEGDRKLVAIKGDPGEVLALCRYQMRDGAVTGLDDADRREIEAANLAMANDALRVLGIAYRSAGAAERGSRIKRSFIWVGLAGMADPIRRGASELVAALGRAGITSVMLTGDQRATAAAIAAELGLSSGGVASVVDGNRIDELGDFADQAAELPRVFARVTPIQKLRLVRRLQHSGRVVAMVGDGVNDTPPLRAADIGITPGRSGVEAARGIADVVLLEDDLMSLAAAIEQGRAVAANIRKAIRYLVATNLSEIIFMLGAAAAGRAHPLSTLQLLWINLLSDILPALALAVEPSPPSVMTRPPRRPQEPVIPGAELGSLVRDASLIAGSAFAARIAVRWLGGSRQSRQAVGFSSLIAAQLFYAFACRSRRGSVFADPRLPVNPLLLASIGASFGAQGAVLFTPGLRDLFGSPISPAQFGIAIAAGAMPLLAIELLRGANLRGA
ncbi:MAG: cation-transporting P-type ATPase [Alphaproteobacteria bacterium]|nr:cation-transporting P-type ATPase [Alphaproteobacteria bacterium]